MIRGGDTDFFDNVMIRNGYKIVTKDIHHSQKLIRYIVINNPNVLSICWHYNHGTVLDKFLFQ